MYVNSQALADELDAASQETPPAATAEPTVIEVDEDGAVTEPGTDVARPDDLIPWGHGIIEDFYGERLEVRKPTQQALAAVSLSFSKYIPQEIQNNMVGNFIRQHMSPKSMERIFYRLMDPEDTAMTPATIGELMRKIVEL